jgi:hypothetical protein
MKVPSRLSTCQTETFQVSGWCAGSASARCPAGPGPPVAAGGATGAGVGGTKYQMGESKARAGAVRLDLHTEGGGGGRGGRGAVSRSEMRASGGRPPSGTRGGGAAAGAALA